jgi:hypothetical protein
MIAEENCPDSVTVMSESHITFTPIETMLACPQLEAEIIGEGEAKISFLFRFAGLRY